MKQTNLAYRQEPIPHPKGSRESELREAWNRKASQAGINTSYFNIKSQVVYENGVPYRVLLNPGRMNRLNKKVSVPTYDESIDMYNRGEGFPNFIFGRDYAPFYISLNIFPIEFGHLTIMHEKQNDFGGFTKEIPKEELKVMAQFVHDTNFRVFHNMDGVGASQPKREHYHGMPMPFPIECAYKEPVSRGEVYKMPQYPGTNLVFMGDDRIQRALDMMHLLHAQGKPHSVILAKEDIYVIPVKTDIVPDMKGKLGSYEFGGTLVASDEQEFDELVKKGVPAVIRNGLFQNFHLDQYV